MYMDFDLLKKCDFFLPLNLRGKKNMLLPPPPPSYSLEWGGGIATLKAPPLPLVLPPMAEIEKNIDKPASSDLSDSLYNMHIYFFNPFVIRNYKKRKVTVYIWLKWLYRGQF